MKRASYSNKNRIIDILSKSFDTNQSVNYIVKQDDKRQERIRYLMDYSFEVCYLFGEVYLSDDNKACALILYPDKKKTALESVILDAKLIFNCIGIADIGKAMDREAKIKKLKPKERMYYLWFIGVDPKYQGSGIGTDLMQSLIEDSEKQQRPIFLETSTLRNLPWYKKFGFETYNELVLTYKLYFLKRKLAKHKI